MKRSRKKRPKGVEPKWLVIGFVLSVFAYWFYPGPKNDSHGPGPQEKVITREERRADPKPSPPSEAPAVRPSDGRGPDDFDSAKGELRKLFARGKDFYCGCDYDLSRKRNIDPTSCGLRAKGQRAERIEWEHVVPASLFGRAFPEWRHGHASCGGKKKDSKGRNCARKASVAFRQMEADMYNLMPAVGTLNQERGNLEFGEVPGEPRDFGACDFEVFAGTVEPRAVIRGDIARIYFYMDARYPGFGIVHAQNRAMLEQWDRDDPMDAKEQERIQKIQAVQGGRFYLGRLSQSPDPNAQL